MMYRILFLFVFLSCGFEMMGQTQEADSLEKRRNWHLKSLEKDGFYGIDWYGAMEFLKMYERKGEIVVAVIDSGVDEDHEALVNRLWTNPGEIPGNGIDDDRNGYVDDVHGWNFFPDDENGKARKMGREADRVFVKLQNKLDSGLPLSSEEAEQYNRLLTISTVGQSRTSYELFKSRLDLMVRVDSISRLSDSDSLAASPDNQALVINRFKKDKADSIKLLTWERVYKYILSEEKFLQKDELEFLYYLQSVLEGGANWKQLVKSFVRSEKAAGTRMEMFRNGAALFERDQLGDDYLDLRDKKYGSSCLKSEVDFHGTHVSGTIAAEQVGEFPAIGVAPDARIMGIKAVANGDEYDKDVALAIRYAVDNGARVINISFGKPFSEHAEWVSDALDYAARRGVLICHSAGNDGYCYDEQLNYPLPFTRKGMRENMLTVGNSTWEGIPAQNTNWGRKYVDLFAPGKLIYSTYSGNQYKSLSGTSMATPVVSGVAALILTYFPELTAKELKQILVESAVIPFACKPFYLFSGGRNVFDARDLCRSGGILNARVAVEKAAALVAAKRK